ncbi:hypothetical protein HOB95_00960 [bacterium]|nr:hypothetical protein [bacterium]
MALILGYSAWIMVADSHITRVSLDVPIYLYNSQSDQISTPNHTLVTLSGARERLAHLDWNEVAFHADAHTADPAEATIELWPTDILLPSGINVVDYKPAQVRLTKIVA